MRKLKPPQIIIFSFLVTILIGAFFLALPQCSSNGISVGVVDALFTATSATCVTGLIVKDTGSDFSRFGQMIILFLLQIGGLGIMTLSTFFAILFGRKLTLRENIVIKSALDHHSVERLKTLILYILALTFCIEAIGAALLYNRLGNVYQSIFHSISAFCNAGFSLNATSFAGYRQDVYVNLVMTMLIILGGIGFIVLIEGPKIFRWIVRRVLLKNREDIKQLFSKISLQTKIAVSVSLILLFFGTLIFFSLENARLLHGFGLKDKILTSFFHSVTSRTAGFNTVSIKDLASPTLFFLIILMFIGASPGSTGGGIKTCTLGVLVSGAISMIKNQDNIHIFKRAIPRVIFRKAVIIAGLAVTWIVVFTMILSFVESRNEAIPNYFLRVLFEVTSAFGTVGLSTGITSILSPLGKVLIMITMLVGRIGPLTLALAMTTREQRVFYKYPQEKVMVG
ncbi:MAG: TrkH family potassium uptake protein [Candidatus Omnitrophica bacterium]|nr:TrkH family potassium uptake protein [Candidatus Omnitrophota bacterium]